MRIASCGPDISMLNTADGFLLVEGDVLGHVHDERRLAHGRAAGDDDELARLQARGHAVEVDEAGRQAPITSFLFSRL